MRTDVRDEELSNLVFCRHLRHIDLTESSVTNKSFVELAKLPRLEWLDLTNNAIDGIPAVNGFPALTDLVLDGCKIDDDGLRGLTQFPKLDRLRLNESKISDEGIETLSQIENLKSLSLENDTVSGLRLDLFNGCQHLEFLNFEVASWPADSVRQPIDATSPERFETVLNDLPKLRTIYTGLYPSLESFQLIDLPELSFVKVSFLSCPHQATKKTPYRKCDYCKQRSNLVRLENLPNLADVAIHYAGQIEISNSENLETLELYDVRHFHKKIRQFPKLKNLRIRESTPLSLEELELIGPVPSLESLTLNLKKLSDESMQVLSLFPNLKRLNIENGIIEGQGIAQIGKLKNLEELSFHWVKTETHELDPIQRLSQLKKLKLRGSIDQLNLSGLSKLEFLNIDADVKSLNLENLPLLKSVSIYDYNEVNSITLRNLAGLESFRKGCDEDNTLGFLHVENLPSLQRLNLDHKNPNPDLNTDSLVNIRNSKLLNELSLRNLTVGEETLNAIHSLDRIRILRAVPLEGNEKQFESVTEKVEKQYFSLDAAEGLDN